MSHRSLLGPVALIATVTAMQGPPGFRSGTELVRLTATVIDQQGNVVRGLRQEAFAVAEDGVSRPISQFAAEQVPLTLVVALDLSTSMRGVRMTHAREAVLALFDRLKPDDEFVVIGFNDSVFDVTNGAKDRSAVERDLARASPGGATALYDAVQTSIRRLDRAVNQRRAVVIISDGHDFIRVVPPMMPAGMPHDDLDAVTKARESLALQTVRRSEALVYSIALNAENALEQDVRALERLTNPTGGITLPVASDAATVRAAERIGDELRVQYLLGFEAGATDGKFHRVVLTVPGCQGCRARTRAGYLATNRR